MIEQALDFFFFRNFVFSYSQHNWCWCTWCIYRKLLFAWSTWIVVVFSFHWRQTKNAFTSFYNFIFTAACMCYKWWSKGLLIWTLLCGSWLVAMKQFYFEGFWGKQKKTPNNKPLLMESLLNFNECYGSHMVHKVFRNVFMVEF